MKKYTVIIKIESENNTKPEVVTLGGDTVFVALTKGQRATWKIKEAKNA